MQKKLKKTTGIKESFDTPIEKILPSISVNAKDLPMLKKAKVDDTFNLTMKVKVRELSRPRYSKDQTLTGILDILAMSPEKQTYEKEYSEAMSNR